MAKGKFQKFVEGQSNTELIIEAKIGKKEFVVVANILKNSKDKKEIIMKITEFFSGINPLFDKEKFLTAAGAK